MIVWLLFLPVFFLTLYSYGYVDFNLTLSSHPLVLNSIGYFQQIVFYNRSLSSNIYLTLLCMTTFAYLATIYHSKKFKLFPWKPIIIIGLLATLSYPMFTHDIFNYLFHAKAVVTHGANPHLVPPQEFVGEEWLRFMHWVHTPSAYGYGFTAYMIIPYILGFTKLTFSLYLYKLMSFGWYLLAIWLIGKIAKRSKLINPTLAQLLFATNPLIIMEWLVNAHNESLMVTLMLLSWYLWGGGRVGSSIITLTIATFNKYAAILIAPALLLSRFIGEHKALLLSTLILLAAPFFYNYPTQYQVWYITWALPFAILSGNRYLIAGTIGYSLGGLLTYLPYVATGFWSLSTTDREVLFITSMIIACIVIALQDYIRKKVKGVSS